MNLRVDESRIPGAVQAATGTRNPERADPGASEAASLLDAQPPGIPGGRFREIALPLAMPSVLPFQNDHVVLVVDPKVRADAAATFLIVENDNVVALGMVDSCSRPGETLRAG